LTFENVDWARKKVEKSIKEYAKGVRKKANLEWVVGEVNFAIEKMHLSIEEIRNMVLKLEASATDEGKKRLAELRAKAKI
jgi:hypothetical protein